jgi:hypothetical protein
MSAFTGHLEQNLPVLLPRLPASCPRRKQDRDDDVAMISATASLLPIAIETLPSLVSHFLLRPASSGPESNLPLVPTL